jgi:hypothetical protein
MTRYQEPPMPYETAKQSGPDRNLPTLTDTLLAACDRQDWDEAQDLDDSIKRMILFGLSEQDHEGLSSAASRMNGALAAIPDGVTSGMRSRTARMLKQNASLAELASKLIIDQKHQDADGSQHEARHLSGIETRAHEKDEQVAPTTMRSNRFRIEDIDLSRVEPRRRDAVRRRIMALEEYDALRYRKSVDMDRLRKPLGISSPHFYKLWQSWRTLRDPVLLQGGNPKPRIRDVVEDERFVRDIMEEVPRDRSTEAKVLEIERVAKERGVRTRSRSALRRLVRRIDEESTAFPLLESPDGLIGLDVTAVELAVDDEGSAKLPLATVILHPRTGMVLSARLSLGRPSPATVADGLARWLDVVASKPAQRDGTRIDAMIFPFARGIEWNDLWSVLDHHGIGRSERRDIPVLPGSVVAGSMGRRILDIEARPRMTRRAPEDRRPLPRSQRLGGPITLVEAQKAIDERIAKLVPNDLYLPGAKSLASELRSLFGA